MWIVSQLSSVGHNIPIYTKRMSLIVSLIFIVLLITSCDGLDYPQVSTPLGRVRGTYKKSYEGRTFSAFEGIPYAKPPVGKLRFEPAQATEPWSAVWIADTLHTCIQGAEYGKIKTIIGEEDCLYINVYTPRNNPTENDGLDVIVHIHGGGFLTGSGQLYTKPNYLMDRDVIFVSFNYRLGILGFLSTQDEVVPGNNGMKDQVLALKWVQDNIRSFGGNPNSITLDGFSAGSASVHLHYFSPLSKGLFHRGYSHSGTALGSWVIQNQPLTKARILAASLGCTEHNSTRGMIDCLKSRPANQIILKLNLFREMDRFALLMFAPTIEESSPDAFLVEDPRKLLKDGNINDVPWLNSVTTHDASFILALGLERLVDILDLNWDTWLYSFFNIRNRVDQFERMSVAKRLKEYYLGNKLSIDKIHELEKLVTDGLFKLDFLAAPVHQAARVKSNVYNILYNYQSNNTMFPILKAKSDIEYGVGHGDDVIFQFASNPEIQLSESDKKMKNKLLDIIASYAKTGSPKVEGVSWKPQTSTDKLNYIQINGPDDIQYKADDEGFDALRFWSSLGLRDDYIASHTHEL